MNSTSRSEWHADFSGEPTIPKLVSLAEAAEQFGISVKMLRRRISNGTVQGLSDWKADPRRHGRFARESR